MKVNTKSIVFAAAITALATPMMAGAVVKTNQTEDVSIPVVYSGYDLSSIEGRAMVERKIQNAARKICGSIKYSETRSFRQVAANKTCYNEAVENALNVVEKLSAAAD